MRKKISQLETSVRSKEVVRDNDAEYKVRMKVYAETEMLHDQRVRLGLETQ